MTTFFETISITARCWIGAASLIALLIWRHLRARAKEKALTTTIKTLGEKIADTERANTDLKTKNMFLHTEMSIKNSKGALLSKYIFLDKWGIWKERSADRYVCPKCLDQGKETPLQIREYGWICNVHTYLFVNPDFHPKIPSQGIKDDLYGLKP